MPLVIADRVLETSTTTGTGNFTLGGAVSGFESFLSAIGEGNTCYYTIAGGSDWEVGLGTITSGALVRTTILKSSNSDTAVNFGAGTKDVFVTYPGDKAVYKDASNNVNALGTITSGVWNGTEITVPYGGTGAASFTAGALLKGNGQSAISTATAGTDYVTPSGTETLTNKTIAFGSNTLTDVAGVSATQTLTNKTLTDPKITLGGTNGTAGQVPVSQGAGLPPVWGTALSAEVKTPTNISPANAATNITETPTLTGSAYYSLYGVPMAAAQWQVSTSSGFGTTVISTGDVAGTAVSYTVLSGVLSVSTTYFWRVRYKDLDGFYSEWSTPTSFTTAAQFNNFIPTPAATPANFGDAFEGGFYTGMIWNQVTQSSTSTAIGIGSKTFTVTDAAPLFYSGQLVEIRSRANPAGQRMIGTVTASSGTTLTVNVASVDGSGTLTDWSVMARYRVIVAPKSSGENSGIAYKNANTAAPTDTGTLSEGWRATEAMRVADTSTVYPAAHWTRNLNINGRTDWYLPARDELEMCWRNLKPVTNNNYTTADRPTGFTPNYTNLGSIGTSGNQHGVNLNSAPQGAAYTTTVPGQVAATAFRTGGAEAFEFGSAFYWSSTEYSASSAWRQHWSSSFPGNQNFNDKTSTFRVRAVRRSII